jgi:long-chain acyl-CoA synthetase
MDSSQKPRIVYGMPSGASRNARGPAAPPDGILRAFDDLLQRRPDAVAVRSPAWRTTRRDLDRQARTIDEAIAPDGLTSGQVVGLAAPNGPAFLAGFVALRRAGCAVLLLDHTAPAAETRRVLAAMRARAVLRCLVDPVDGRVHARAEPVGVADAPSGPLGRAVIKLTSGSTGAPRGVAVGTEALLADEDALARTMGFRDDDRLVAAVPMSHSYGFTTLALSALVRGLEVIVPADDGPYAPLAAAEACGATVFPTVPAYLQAVLAVSQPPAWPASVRLFISAGAPLPPVTATRFRAASGRPVHVFYGSSECGGICYDRTGDAGERGTVGTPVEGVSISLAPLDAEPGCGRLTVQSAAVGETYLPESDAGLAGGRFQTADLATWQGDEIVLIRRVDRVVNVRGFKVDPSEVEQIIAALAGVDDVVVTGASFPDHAGAHLRAVVACRSGTIDAAQVTAWCRSRLAEHRVPRRVLIVDALPRTSRGKVDRAALETLADAGARPVGADG